MPAERELLVSELFFSIQGESSFAGLPCVFIRLAGCNLRCRYCDAGYTYEEEGERRTITELLDFAAAYHGAIVEITGGEPLLHKYVIDLMAALLEKGRQVLLETNGSQDISKVPEGVVRIVDLKCPGSGMAQKMRYENLELLTPGDEVKFVLSSREDYEWARQTLAENRTLQQSGDREGPTILFSPVPGKLTPAELSSWILADRLPVRLQLQLHKIIWPEIERGV